MDGEPHGGRVRIGPFDAMPHMRGDQQGIAGAEVAGMFFTFQAELRGTLQDEDPLRLGLVVPETDRRRLSVRDDPFDADTGSRGESFEAFGVVCDGKGFKKIQDAHEGTSGGDFSTVGEAGSGGRRRKNRGRQ